MSGHNKWSTIKHKKGAADAKRGKLFTKLIREITVAARMGGGDGNSNPRLRSAMMAARGANMPNDTIERAIKRGTGELEGVEYEEISYEGYGPAGVAIFVEAMTDNRNRTVAEVRHVFSKHNGNMGESGCVAWMFDKAGVIVVPREGTDEEALMDKALEAGAEDVREDGELFELRCAPSDVDEVAEKLRVAGVTVESAQAAMVPQNTVKVEGRDAEVLFKLINALEDLDDIQNVWANFDIDDELLEQLSQ
ncbi:MAG: YebC/PmpR family DNA-binding transcriptional regulator [Deltaproteobacteria bacterium]|nr:YebC/PmpR family DNA-binding transcriptional regulator [Deltaproteobacteria bacterium]